MLWVAKLFQLQLYWWKQLVYPTIIRRWKNGVNGGALEGALQRSTLQEVNRETREASLKAGIVESDKRRGTGTAFLVGDVCRIDRSFTVPVSLSYEMKAQDHGFNPGINSPSSRFLSTTRERDDENSRDQLKWRQVTRQQQKHIKSQLCRFISLKLI
ncbi:hypothetical protein BDZ45DRAFT_685741 [Acephala macrosclerotiorum]|nr:hypothetical protein BDZ45DRAFT_685741 [Acephala macrosclerotiorum]